jgi:acetyl esterase/lipase
MKYTITIGLMCFAVVGQAQTSENNPRLSAALKRFPRADANGDGVLTLQEAKAFKRKKQVDEPKQQDHRDVEGGRSYIYKRVGEQQLPLYVFTPPGHADGAKVPAIVFFHGGGFKTGSASQFTRQCQYLAARGMVAITVRYRLTSEKGVEVTDCVEDAISAMRWVRANADKLGVDPNRIASGGGSAGGFLAVATLLVNFISADTDPPGVSAQPNTLVLFNPGFGRPENDGKPDPRDPEGKYDFKKYVKPNQPPMIHFFGTEDLFLPVAREFIEAYKKTGNRCELITYEGEGHSFFNKDKYYELTIAETDKFLTGLGWLEN